MSDAVYTVWKERNSRHSNVCKDVKSIASNIEFSIRRLRTRMNEVKSVPRTDNIQHMQQGWKISEQIFVKLVGLSRL